MKKRATKSKAREKFVGVRLHDDEFRDVVAYAVGLGLEVATWLRTLAVSTARAGGKKP